ncbi:MAG: hypothetical protein JWP00_3378 [Chloroflexi bacterium]|nr:hypothetical protein [Chloroflexota bacterium]
MTRRKPTLRCAQPGCGGWARKDGSGLCFNHNPELEQARKDRNAKISVTKSLGPAAIVRQVKRGCEAPGCRGWGMRDNSGLCFWHNPATQAGREDLLARRAFIMQNMVPPPERACRKAGCGQWDKNDGSGFCFQHNPVNAEYLRNQLKGNKLNLGRHLPWLGLENIDEARGLIFYALINDKPLLLLRALTKVASLHARGEMFSPQSFAAQIKWESEAASEPGDGEQGRNIF